METLFDMPAWQIFAAIGVLLAVAEIFMPGFIVLPIGIGFLLTAPVAMATDSLGVQLAALAIIEVIVFVLMRRYGPKLGKTQTYSAAEGMVGQECEVIEDITPSRLGYVKLYGDRWQAKSFTETLLKGSRATIVKLEGNKVIVEAMDSNSTGGKNK